MEVIKLAYRQRWILALLAFLVFSPLNALAQFQPQGAQWIAFEAKAQKDAEVLYFRKSFALASTPHVFPIRISADNRFRLYVNGQFVASGPEHSDLNNWRYQGLDIAPYLIAGKNTVAVEVWNWGPLRPVAQYSLQTGLLVEGLSSAAKVIDSDDSWKVFKNTNHRFIPVSGEQVGGYYAASPGEEIHGADYPSGWTSPDYNDTEWKQAAGLRLPVMDKGVSPFGVAVGWQLTPGTLPQMEEKPVRFDAVRIAKGISVTDALLQGKAPLTIKAHSTVSLLLDQSQLTNAYFVVKTEGGAGSEIKITYAESLKYADGTKGNRNDINDKVISGVVDKIYPAGETSETFQTLWFRTYRYVQLDIQTADSPLTINDVSGIFTAYPLKLNASIHTNQKWIDDVWDINWRTIRLCAYDTYFDTPYYEQLQYTGDTRIQAILSLYLSGDDRLVRQAIEQYGNSLSSEGLTASRYPSEMAQYIPPFSLVWVMMIHDYYMLRGDTEWLSQYLPAVRSVLAWFQAHTRNDGLIGPVSWWPFMDWVPEWERGIPPGGLTGGSTLISLQYVYALQLAADLENAFGIPGQGDAYLQQASAMQSAINTHSWDAKTGLYRDVPESAVFSQQTNVMAILTDTQNVSGQRALMRRVLDTPDLAQATYYFKFYLFEALNKAGLGDQYLQQLVPWQDMLAKGLTSTPENPDPTRSDSHAWAAHPNYGLLSIVLGIRSESAGFSQVAITPHLGELKQVEGNMPHPLGNISVQLQRQGDTGITGTITLPENVTGIFKWQGNAQTLRAGTQTINIE